MSHSFYQSIHRLTVTSFSCFHLFHPCLFLFPFLHPLHLQSLLPPFIVYLFYSLLLFSSLPPPPRPSTSCVHSFSFAFSLTPPSFSCSSFLRRSLSLIQALLNITEQGYYSDVMNIFYVPMRQCPELLFLGIISSTVRFTLLLGLGSMDTNDLYHFCIVLLHWPHTQATWTGNEAACYANITCSLPSLFYSLPPPSPLIFHPSIFPSFSLSPLLPLPHCFFPPSLPPPSYHLLTASSSACLACGPTGGHFTTTADVHQQPSHLLQCLPVCMAGTGNILAV